MPALTFYNSSGNPFTPKRIWFYNNNGYPIEVKQATFYNSNGNPFEFFVNLALNISASKTLLTGSFGSTDSTALDSNSTGADSHSWSIQSSSGGSWSLSSTSGSTTTLTNSNLGNGSCTVRCTITGSGDTVYDEITITSQVTT